MHVITEITTNKIVPNEYTSKQKGGAFSNAPPFIHELL